MNGSILPTGSTYRPTTESASDREINDRIRALETELASTPYGERYDELDREIDTLAFTDLKPQGAAA